MKGCGDTVGKCWSGIKPGEVKKTVRNQSHINLNSVEKEQERTKNLMNSGFYLDEKSDDGLACCHHQCFSFVVSNRLPSVSVGLPRVILPMIELTKLSLHMIKLLRVIIF